jgi:hypothetical protein
MYGDCCTISSIVIKIGYKEEEDDEEEEEKEESDV